MNASSLVTPEYDVDLYSDEVHEHPHLHYKRLRDLGPVVWLPKNSLWAVGRYQDVKACLRDTENFVSGEGVAVTAEMNGLLRGTMLCSDDEPHAHKRRIIGSPILPGALAPLIERVDALCDERVASLMSMGEFDAVTKLAQFLPLAVVTELVGLSEEGRTHMLDWAAAVFDTMGAPNERARQAAPKIVEMLDYIKGCVERRAVTPGSWGDRIFQAADRGEVPMAEVGSLLLDYIAPSLDTTINATSALVWSFAKRTDQWDLLRAEPGLLPGAINEVVRLESPIRAFTRYVKHDVKIGGVSVPAGSRAMMLFASANRDERKWSRPDEFDIRRPNADHLGFGHGSHQCAGMHLARLEMTCLFKALIPRVNRFELVGPAVHGVNNILRGLAILPIRLL